MSSSSGRLVTDERLSQFARLHRRSGDPLDGARQLAERLRAARLTRARLILAKVVGDPGAALLLPSAPRAGGPRVWVEPRTLSANLLRRRVRALGSHGREPLVVAAVAAARFAGLDGPALAAAEGWLACPCPAHVDSAGLLAERPQAPDHPGDARAPARALWAVAATLAAPDEITAKDRAIEAVQCASRVAGCEHEVRLRSRCGCDGPRNAGLDAAMRAAIRAWALR